MLDDAFTFRYDLPFLVPYTSFFDETMVDVNYNRFQQEWLMRYVNSKILVQEVFYQCFRNTKQPELQKRCENKWSTFSNDTYDYLSGLATQEDIK